jgi:hypothetical protein
LKALELGSWDGDEIPLPKDVSRDGIADFIVHDGAFLYAFASYASSIAPPKILNVQGGKVINVSRRAAYRTLFEATMRDAGERCSQGADGDTRNGACPAYVAAAARLGQLEPAWKRMVASYDATTRWDFPTRCKVSGETCPEGQEISFKSYPEALLDFLKVHGYISQGWKPPEPYQEEAEPDVADGSTDTI